MREVQRSFPSLPLPLPAREEAPTAADLPRPLARTARLWAVLVVALALLNFGLAIWYFVRTGDDSYFFTHQLFLPFLAITYTFLGSVTISQRPRNPIGWIFLCVSTFYLLTGLSASAIDGVLPTALTPPAVLDFAYWSGNWAWLPAQVLPLTFVFLLFPDGRLPSRRWRPIGWAAGLGLAALILGLAAHPGPLSDWNTTPNPYGIAGAEKAMAFVITAASLLLAIGLAGSIVAVIVRFRRSRGIERAQMKWLVFAAIVVLVLAVFTVPLWRSGGLDGPLAMELSIVLTNLVTLGIAMAVTVAILRYRLYDIDILINRTLVYSIMTGVVLLIYGLIVGAAGVLFQSQGNWFIALLATALVAVLFQPIRDRLQRTVNRLLYGQRDEPFEVLARLGQRLEQTLSPDAVYPAIVETVAQALHLPYVGLCVRDGDGFRVAESYGLLSGEPISYPLTYQGESVGQLLVDRRGAEDGEHWIDERLLRNIARQAGVAVHSARLTTDLQRSRQQIVTSREEERRRLRRDLHDGLGPSLASLLIEARVLRRMIHADPAAADRLAVEMQGDIRTTIDDVRRVVQELRPTALDDLGLVAALNVLARKISQPEGVAGAPTSLQVQIDAPDDLPPLPAAVEVATYRIVQEALTNVVHHAHARCAIVRVCLNRDLAIEIADDGIGFSAGRDEGVGLHSMRERASELGGSLTVARQAGGGTIVRAVLPLPEEP